MNFRLPLQELVLIVNKDVFFMFQIQVHFQSDRQKPYRKEVNL